MQPGQKSFIGGAQLGSFNATMPFARLLISRGKLSLRCFKKFELNAKDAVCEAYGVVPLFYWGVRFHHGRADLPDPFIFWCVSRKRVLTALASAGFEVR